jgi:hypothetical protein
MTDYDKQQVLKKRIKKLEFSLAWVDAMLMAGGSPNRAMWKEQCEMTGKELFEHLAGNNIHLVYVEPFEVKEEPVEKVDLVEKGTR